MATTYPGTIQTFTDPSGTSPLATGPDHAQLHTDINDTLEAVQTVMGTTAGTAVLKNLTAGQFVVSDIGTATLTNKTLTSPVINTQITGNAIATGAEVTTGTDDTQIVTPKALGDAGVNTRLKSKIISFTRDLAAVTADVSYTGVGFTPTALVGIGAISGSYPFTIGLADSAVGESNIMQYATNTLFPDSRFLTLATSAGVDQKAVVKTYDADGFTLTWTKGGGSPTGTATCYVLCLR